MTSGYTPPRRSAPDVFDPCEGRKCSASRKACPSLVHQTSQVARCPILATSVPTAKMLVEASQQSPLPRKHELLNDPSPNTAPQERRCLIPRRSSLSVWGSLQSLMYVSAFCFQFGVQVERLRSWRDFSLCCCSLRSDVESISEFLF